MKFFKRFASIVALGLSFNVQIAAALEVVQYTAADNFTLNVATGNPNQDFGTVHIQSDSPTGWILRVRSTNQGALKHSASNSTIPYILRIDGDMINNLDSGNDVTVRTTSTLTCNAPNGCNLPVRASIVASEVDGKPSGQYSDTLIFTLTNH